MREQTRGLRVIKLRLLFRLCLLCACPLTAQAHEFWLEPSSYHTIRNQEVRVDAIIGESFFGDPLVYLPRQTKRFDVTAPVGVLELESVFAEDPMGRFTPRSDGLHIVAYEKTGITDEFDALKFEKYLQFYAIDAVRLARQERGHTDKNGRERYSRFAKSYIYVGDAAGTGGFDQPVGLRFELIPLTDPRRQTLGGSFSLRLVFEQTSLADTLVVGFPAAKPEQTVRARSDSNGIVQLPITHTGNWLFSAVHMVPGNNRRYDWESFWGTLTLNIR